MASGKINVEEIDESAVGITEEIEQKEITYEQD
jgi:hypothetical protein